MLEPKPCERCGVLRSPGVKEYPKRWNARRFCIRCSRTQDLTTRFWRHVEKTETCWLWTGSRDRKGYGRFYVEEDGTTISSLATHASWFLEHGRWPSLWLLHRCDNPPCIRPLHLYEGTVKENARDAVERGRAIFGDRSGRAKLSNSLALQIFHRAKAGEKQRNIARQLNVSESTVSMIVRGRTWQKVINA